MKKSSIILSFFLLLRFLTGIVFAQHEHGGQKPGADPQSMPAMENMNHTENAGMSEASNFLMNEGAGTGVNPSSAPMAMKMIKKNQWDLMVHGYAFLNAMEQSGPRGKDRVFSANHLMFMAEHAVSSKSSFLFRTMLSLEPATVTDRFYPELFQTGETAFGKPIVDGQHPHDFFMELSFQYAVELSKDSLMHFYFAPIGDPALGPVAFPHRASAAELPQATLAHHLQDSTHIASDVLTAGFKYKVARIELSGFHGGEPDEDRWDIDQGAIDSWSTRLTLTPTPNWAAQVSTGKLKKPEALEPGDIQRTTASVSYTQPIPDGQLSAGLIWGRNHKTFNDSTTNSYTAEGLYSKMKNNFTGRIELVDKDELFAGDQALHGQTFRINAFTFGYSRDLPFISTLQSGIGATVTSYSFPDALKPFYGSSPMAVLFYFRIRPGHSHTATHQM